MLTRLWRWWTDDRIAFNDDQAVDRFFVICTQCARVRPYYHIVAKKADAVMHCPTCGNNKVRPHIISNVRAFWALIVQGWLVRHILRGKAHQSEWDPRMPYRKREFEGFA